MNNLRPKSSQKAISGNNIYDSDGAVRAEFLANIQEALALEHRDILIALIAPMHESELGDILEILPADSRAKLVKISGNAFDFRALTEVDEAVRLEIINEIPNVELAVHVQDIDSDDAVYILEDMSEADQHEVLDRIPFEERIRLRRSLKYPEETAGRRMQTELIAVPPFWSIGQTIDYMRDDKNLPERFLEIFVIEPSFELIGTVALDRLLRTKQDVKISDIMQDSIVPIDALTDQEEAAMLFERYDLLSAPVIDENRHLVGVLTIDDVVDMIRQEADEDIKRLAGIGDEELSDNVLAATRSRFMWLLINLATSIIASLVIFQFEAIIEQIVALAVLMPIVASMGGNAGTQTMTITVRALATRDIDSYNSWRIACREIMVALINGSIFAFIAAIIASVWFSLWGLGVVIGLAMIINMLCAAVAGFTIPLMLNRLSIDPAIASTVFVTTVTDVIGFFTFLGLAVWWFGL